MDTMQGTSEVGAKVALSIAVWDLRQAVERCLLQKDVGRFCNVIVKENGRHLELSGTVDSEWTHAEILSLLPDDERCVADNIQVISRPESYRIAG